LLIGTNRHWVVLAEGALGADLKFVRGLDDGVEPHDVLQLHSHGVEGVLQSIG